MLTIACSSSPGRFCAVLDSGRLICTSGWSFLKVVETTKKMSRMIRISTSETIIMRGARRFRTAKFMCSDTPRVSRYRRRNRYVYTGRRFCHLKSARRAAVIQFINQLDDQRFHLYRHHFYLSGKIGEPDQRRHGDRKPEHGGIQCFGDAERDLARVRRARAQSEVRKNMHQSRDRADQTEQWCNAYNDFENDETFFQAHHLVACTRLDRFHIFRTRSAQMLQGHANDPCQRRTI